MEHLQYEDLDVLIERSGKAFRARVARSPGGESASLPFVVPVSPEKLELLVLRLRSAHGMRALATDTTPDTRQFGSALFEALFHDDLLDRLRRSLDRTEARGRGLRIRLRFSDAHELWNIPWEFLYDEESHRFLCQFDRTPVVRYVDLAQPIQPLTIDGPIRMLVMISSPGDYPPLDVEKEWHQLSTALKPLEATGGLQVARLPTASLEELRHTMMFGDFHLFHFIGHGGLDKETGDGLLALTGSDGRSQLATGAELFVMLANSPIRLAVLNSCLGARISAVDPFAGAAASLVHQGIPAVVAMQFEISDHAAIAFSRTLYEAIAYGWPVDTAVSEARRAILATSKSEWATPVLYLRAPDGHLLDVAPPDKAPAPPQPAEIDGSVTDSTVALTWAATPAGLTPVSRWEIRRDGTAVAQVTEPRGSDTPPGPGPHRYTVVSIGADGQRSAESSTFTAVIPGVTPAPEPAAPTGLSGSTTDGRVELHWNGAIAGEPEIDHWEVFRDGISISVANSPQASDSQPGYGSHAYTVVAVGAEGGRSAESIPWTANIRPDRPPWLVPALAILALVAATVGLLLWAPWEPDTAPSPTPPTGLSTELSGTVVDLTWDPAPPDSAPVARWEVRRDGVVVADVTSPQAADPVPGPGTYTYTLVAIGDNGQRSLASEGSTVTVPDSGGDTPPPIPEWQKLPNEFQENFTAAGVAEHNDELWVVGGAGQNGPRNEVRVFNPQTGLWRDGPTLPAPVHHAPLVSTGDQLFLLGGLTGEDTRDTVYRLDSPEGAWVEDAPLPEPRFSGAAAWDGQRLVFAGGTEQLRPRPASADIWALDGGEWVPVGELSRAREHLAAVSDGAGVIWFIGGADVELGRGSVVPTVDVLHDDTVDQGSDISPARQGAAAIWTANTGVCLFGGSLTLPNAEVDPIAQVGCQGGSGPAPAWPELPEARSGAGAAVIGDTVYVVGGFPELTAEDMVLALPFG